MTSLLLLALLSWFLIHSTQAEQDITNVSISITVNTPEGLQKAAILSFPANELELELIVGNFCEDHDIQAAQCRQLHELASTKLSKAQQAAYRKTVINPGYGIGFHPTGSGEPLVPPQVPVAHWTRHPDALIAEYDSEHRDVARMQRDEEAAWRALQQFISTLLPPTPGIPRSFVFLHSCLLASQSPAILTDLLTAIRATDLDAVLLVLHYGPAFTLILPESVNPSPLWVMQVSELTEFFEIPTIRIMHKFAMWMGERDGTGNLPELSKSVRSQSVRSPTHILYLHTKGVSYQTRHSEVEDWKAMMMHFLVEQHSTCAHLLHAFDVIGTNYHSHPRALSGNYWWATAKYLAGLPQLSLRDDKYAPERWVLTGRTVHLYNAHTGHFQHTLHGYPRYCYASDVAAPEFAQWAQDCLNTQQAEYNRLHAPESYGEGLSIRMTGMLLYNP